MKDVERREKKEKWRNNRTEEGRGGRGMEERKERIDLRKENKREEHRGGRRERRKVEGRQMRRCKRECKVEDEGRGW